MRALRLGVVVDLSCGEGGIKALLLLLVAVVTISHQVVMRLLLRL